MSKFFEFPASFESSCKEESHQMEGSFCQGEGVKKEVITLSISNQGPKVIAVDEFECYLGRYRPPERRKKKHGHAEMLRTYNPTNLPTIWLDILYPKFETMQYLADAFRIHPLTIEDCLSGSEEDYQKSETFEYYRFVSFSEFRVVKDSNTPVTVDIRMIMPTHAPVIISVHTKPVEYLTPVMERIFTANVMVDRGGATGDIPSAEWVMYLIFDTIVDRIFPLISSCLFEIASLDELVLLSNMTDEENDLLRRLGSVRKLLTSLRTQLSRKHDVINSMLAPTSWLSVLGSQDLSKLQLKIRRDPKFSFLHEESADVHQLRLATVHLFLRDVNDHIVVMLNDLEQAKDMLLSLTNTYLTRVSIETSLANNKQNEIMKKFNAMATVVLPLTFIASLWGMNVKVPWQDYQNDYRGFIIITIILIVMSVLIFYGLRKLKWY